MRSEEEAMGSWTELDANYPPGALTPATALIVALGHLVGTTHVDAEGQLAAFLPDGLGYDADLLGRVERYLGELPLDQFLVEAAALLSPRQKLVVALQLLDRQLAAGDRADQRALLNHLIAGIGPDADALARHRATLALKNELDLFPQ
ncbi:MAG TPA: hypothetical protein PKD53_21390 [Chloroflexaceae bacterium]|nr:hypothetical protein [Chloroflexaceae bacterium]